MARQMDHRAARATPCWYCSPTAAATPAPCGVGAAAQQGFFGLGGGNDDLDEDTLKGIAQATGGEYFRATDAGALQQVYTRIDQLEPSAGHEQWYRPSTEWYPWPLGLALLLSLPAILLRERAWS